MILKVNEKEYTVEFKFRVARNEKYRESLKIVTDMMTGILGADGKLVGQPKDFMSAVINSIADKPSACATLLYVGLTSEPDIKTLDDAWELMFSYMEQDGTSYDELYTCILEQMSDDGFFEWSGLNQTMSRLTETVKELPKGKKSK